MGAELQEGRGGDEAFDWQAPAVAQGIPANEARALYRMAVNKTDSDPRQAEELYLGWLEDRRSGQPPRPPGRSTRTKQDGPGSGQGSSSTQQPSTPGRRTLTEALPAAEPAATGAKSRRNGSAASGQGAASGDRGSSGEGGSSEPGGERAGGEGGSGELPRIDLRDAGARRASRDAQAGGAAAARAQASSELPLGFSDRPGRGGVPGASAAIGAGLGAPAALGAGIGAPAALDAGLGAPAALEGGLGASAALEGGLGASAALEGGLGAASALAGAPGASAPGAGAPGALADRPGGAPPAPAGSGDPTERPGSPTAERPNDEPGSPTARPGAAGLSPQQGASGSDPAVGAGAASGATAAGPGGRGAGPAAATGGAGPAAATGGAGPAAATGGGRGAGAGAGPAAARGAGPAGGAGPGGAGSVGAAGPAASGAGSAPSAAGGAPRARAGGAGAGPAASAAAAGGAAGARAAGAGAAGIEGVLVPEAPAALTPAAQGRLDNVGAQNQTAATATTTLPTAEQTTAQARGAVQEPQAEQDARAGAEVVADIDTRPPPSPEIEAACERIREVIRAKRPPDEKSLVDAKPREMAQEAGTQMSADVESRAGSVRDGYADMQGQPQGQPSRQPVPAQLPPDQVATPAVDAGAAAPDALAPSDVSLDRDVAAQEQRIEGAGMTTEPAQLVQDGPIAEARGGLGELQQMAGADPQKVLAEQAAAVDQARLDMRTLQASAAQQLQQARSGTVHGVGQHSTQVTGTEEEKRAQAGAQMQAVFQRTQTSVDGLLQPLSQTALARWEAGIDTLSTAFETSLASVKSRIEERYQADGNILDPRDELGSIWNRGHDAVLGLPDWVVEEYDRAEATFADGATTLIRDISRDVNAVILSCQSLIQQARRDIDAIVQSLPAELQAWAQGEATRLGEQLDALDTQVTDTQASLNRDLVDRANTAVQEVRTRVHELRVAAGGLLGRITAAIEAFIRDPFRAIVNGLLSLVGIPQANFWALVDRLPNVISGIAENPMGFANTLMAGVGQGFQQFFDNFPGHIGRALFQWLFSRIGEAGVRIPPDFSPRSILGLVLDVLGISWERIRTILARHIGQQNADLLDKAYQVISTLIERGPQGLIDMFVEQLDPNVIVEMLLQTALDYVTQAIITQVSTRILMMLNPAGAILQAIEAIYRVVNWIINNAARIFTLIESIVNGAAAILAGDTSGVANLVEQSLVRLMVPVIDFLADYLGLGGIPEAIRNLILGLQGRVEAILDRVIGFIADRARALMQSIRGGNQQGSNGIPPEGQTSQRVPKSIVEPRPASLDTNISHELADALWAAPSGTVIYQRSGADPARATNDLLAQHPAARFDEASGQLTLSPLDEGGLVRANTLADLGRAIAEQTGVTKVTVAHAGSEVTFEGHINPSSPLGRWDFSRESDRRHDDIAHGGYYKRKAWRTRLQTASYSDHGRKHLQARTEEDAKQISRNGDAQYLPSVNNGALEREALQNGEVIRGEPSDRGSTVHVKYDFGYPVGYFKGRRVTSIRAEITSGNVFHGHPRDQF